MMDSGMRAFLSLPEKCSSFYRLRLPKRISVSTSIFDFKWWQTPDNDHNQRNQEAITGTHAVQCSEKLGGQNLEPDRQS